MVYELHELELTGIQVQRIGSVEILHRPGEHGRLILTAELSGEQEKTLFYHTDSGQPLILYGNRDGKRKPIFCGILTKLEGRSMGKGYQIKVKALTYSYLMDRRKKSRSFQDISLTIGTLVGQVLEEYGGQYQLLFPDQPMGEIAVQYEETDWQFLKRMLSLWHIPLVSSEVQEGVCLYCGIPQIPAQLSLLSVEKVWKDREELAYWKEHGKEAREEEALRCQVRLQHSLRLYEEVDFQGRRFSVAETIYQTQGSSLEETVTLLPKEALRQRTIYPVNLIGSALEGRILEVQGERVRIHLNIDEKGTGEDCYWFPFSSPSVSSDRSGWYCMPEPGDVVRVYFPGKRTKEVMAIGAVSTYETPRGKRDKQEEATDGIGSRDNGRENTSSGERMISGEGRDSRGSTASYQTADSTALMGNKTEEKDRMGNTANKYLRTMHGHEVRLSPQGIRILCSEGTAVMDILKSGRIDIYAAKGIHFHAEKELSLQAEGVLRVQGKERMDLVSQQGGILCLMEDGKLVMQGMEVHMN